MAGEGVMKTLSLSLESFPDEVWEDIPGYEDRYLISNYSRVKSTINKNHKIIKKTISNGRMKVFIYNKFGIGKSEECGRLSARVYLGEPKDNEVLNRKDGNILNDEVSNLEWKVKNTSYRSSHKTAGEKNGMAILTANQVVEIRNKRNKGNTYGQLKDEYKVSIGCIHNIITGKKWKTV